MANDGLWRQESSGAEIGKGANQPCAAIQGRVHADTAAEDCAALTNKSFAPARLFETNEGTPNQSAKPVCTCSRWARRAASKGACTFTSLSK